ncbi:dodecin family protein [Nocardioides sp. B-3]|uniref:dodecin family protein n=1 Tax=Nocardioides sp. B-3 TaxID=2895565 RepID=UPI0021532BF4|nr:dodecin family protein [Nocardioides sp. B-3]
MSASGAAHSADLRSPPCPTAPTASPRSSAPHPTASTRAVRNGIERASKTLRHIDWFEITRVRGRAKDGRVEHFRVGLKVGFRLEDE